MDRPNGPFLRVTFDTRLRLAVCVASICEDGRRDPVAGQRTESLLQRMDEADGLVQGNRPDDLAMTWSDLRLCMARGFRIMLEELEKDDGMPNV